MNVADLARLVALLSRLARSGPPPVDDRHVAIRRGVEGPGSTVTDRYDPRGARRATVIAVHGVLLPGREDARLAHFGWSLARSGVACVVPTLVGLADARSDPADLDTLEALVAAEARASGGPIGIVAFCYGGAYALLAAARPSIADQVSFVLCFGAYYDLEQVLDEYFARADVEPQTAEDWDNWIYIHLVTAYREMESLDLPPALRGRVAVMLRDYCDSVSVADKRDLFERELRPRSLIRYGEGRRDHEIARELSPRGKLAGLRAVVSLIHDPDDIIVPAGHSRQLMTELQSLPGAERHRLAITSLISHTDLGTVFRLKEIAVFLSALEPIVSVTPKA